MSLNNIILPDVLLSALYKNNLFDINDSTKNSGLTEQPDLQPPLQFLGKHLQQIAVFVHYPGEIYLPEAQLNFLANILKACSLNIADIAIINIAAQQVDAALVRSVLNSKKLLFFDVEPAALNLEVEFPAFSVEQHNNMSLLKAPALEKLNQGNEEGKLLKSKLWLCLKELFSVQ